MFASFFPLPWDLNRQILIFKYRCLIFNAQSNQIKYLSKFMNVSMKILWQRKKSRCVVKKKCRNVHRFDARTRGLGFCSPPKHRAGLHDNVPADLRPRWKKVRQSRATQPRCTVVPDFVTNFWRATHLFGVVTVLVVRSPVGTTDLKITGQRIAVRG